jgi:threonine dehydrogenase-like Zn-dependent dehydrogenase
MEKVVTFFKPGEVGITEIEDIPIKPHEVRLQTLYSGISAGTELTHYRGSNVYLHKQWDNTNRLFLSSGGTTSKTYPIIGTGYEECGKIIEVGNKVTKVAVGEVIYGTWQHRTHKVVHEDYAAQRILPQNMEPILGIFSQMTAIAYNGILDAAIRLGETVAVFGLGVPGQICAQMAKRSGAKVIGIDLIESRLKMSQKLGSVDLAFNASDGEVAEKIRDNTNGRGVDIAFELSGAYPALQEAIRSVAYSSKVIALGFYQGAGESLFLGEEFHHNRVNIICSQISGVTPELSNRWDVDRMVRRGIELQSEGVLNLKPLISHEFSLSELDEAYDLLDRHPEQVMQAVINFQR